MISTDELMRLLKKASEAIRIARVTAEQMTVRPQQEQIELVVSSLQQACSALEFAQFGKEFSTIEERIYPSRSAIPQLQASLTNKDNPGLLEGLADRLMIETHEFCFTCLKSTD